MTASLGLGLIGVGRWGRNYVRTIGAVDGAHLAAVASRNPETPALLPSGARMHADWRDLVADPSVDAVVIASPPSAHAAPLIAAVEAGKPVLAEKPLTDRPEELAAMRGAVARHGGVVMVEHTHLFHDAFRALVDHARAAGGARAVRAAAGNFGPIRPNVSVLWDWGPHDVAMALDLFGAETAIVRAARRLAHEDKPEGRAERIALDLTIAGAPVALSFSTKDARHRWFAVDLADSTLIYSDQAGAPLKRCPVTGAPPDAPGEILVTQAGPPLTVAVETFIAAIRHGDACGPSFSLACAVVETLAKADAELHDVE